MIRLRPLTLSALAATALFLSACDERLSDLTGPTPDIVPTFASIQSQILEAPDSSGRPACTNCHNPVGARFTGMDLTHDAAYATLVDAATREKPGTTRVIPGDPANSYLIQKLEGTPGIVGQRMPLGGPYLTAGQIAVIRRWIETGAARN